MKRIPLGEARPGMILARNLVRDDGVLLCPEGAEITESLLERLERMNIESIEVKIKSVESPEEKTARIQKAEQDIEKRFLRVASDPILAQLKATLVKRLHTED